MVATRLHGVLLLGALAATSSLAAPAFRPDGPFDAECRVDERAFAGSWIKYSDIDERIAVASRSWEAKQLVQTADRIKQLTVTRDAIAAEMEVDRHARLALREYREALVKDLKTNLLKAFFRLAYITYGTMRAGKGVGESYSKLFTGVSAVQNLGAGLQVINGLKPQASYESRSAELAGKVLSVHTSTVLAGLEKLGDPVEMATAFVSEATTQVLPSADLTPAEIGVLRDQHLNRHVADQILDESYRRNLARRDEVARIDGQLTAVRAELKQWKEKEQTRVRLMLIEDCKRQRQRALAVDAPAPVAKPVAGAGACASALGSWKWGSGVATFSGDASGGTSAAAGNPYVSQGTWRCTGPGELEIRWNNGRYVDRMKVSGGEMSGRNQSGAAVRATRSAPPAATRPAGPETCKWLPGGTMFPSLCECTRSDRTSYHAPRSRCGH